VGGQALAGAGQSRARCLNGRGQTTPRRTSTASSAASGATSYCSRAGAQSSGKGRSRVMFWPENTGDHHAHAQLTQK
jgi:hypothetical protein